MSRKLKWAILIAGLPVLVGTLFSVYAQWAWGGHFQPTLDPQYVPTAQSLVQNPLPTLEYLKIQPAPGSTIKQSDAIQFSIWFLPDHITGTPKDVWTWSQVFVNNQRIDRLAWGSSLVGTLSSDTSGIMRNLAGFSFVPQVEPGLHLFRIQIGTSIDVMFNPNPKSSYQWAYRVE